MAQSLRELLFPIEYRRAFMNTKITALAASIAFVLSASAYAQTSPGTSGSSAQAARSGGGQQNQSPQVDQQYKAAMEKCNGMQGNAKDICKAEADGQKKVDQAQAKLTKHESPKNRLEVADAKAEAQYKVAKARCGDQVGDAKKACENEAKAAQNLAKAQAKRESLTQASGAQNAASSGSSGTSGSTGTSGSGGATGTEASGSQSGGQMGSPGSQQPKTQAQ
jgi:hypothetical protein